MNAYLAMYDLSRVKDYPRLYSCFEILRAKRILESSWVVHSGMTAPQLRQMLAHYIDGDDAVVVVQVTPDADWATLRARREGVAMLAALDFGLPSDRVNALYAPAPLPPIFRYGG